MAEVLVDPLQLARRYGFQGETQDGNHLANGMFAPWDAIKTMAYDRARLSDENDELRKKMASRPIDSPELLEAMQDMLAGWIYIRQNHGDLYGVGWDRAQQKAEAAIAKAKP